VWLVTPALPTAPRPQNAMAFPRLVTLTLRLQRPQNMVAFLYVFSLSFWFCECTPGWPKTPCPGCLKFTILLPQPSGCRHPSVILHKSDHVVEKVKGTGQSSFINQDH
jgi:hypothetical protein